MFAELFFCAFSVYFKLIANPERHHTNDFCLKTHMRLNLQDKKRKWKNLFFRFYPFYLFLFRNAKIKQNKTYCTTSFELKIIAKTNRFLWLRLFSFFNSCIAKNEEKRHKLQHLCLFLRLPYFLSLHSLRNLFCVKKNERCFFTKKKPYWKLRNQYCLPYFF